MIDALDYARQAASDRDSLCWADGSTIHPEHWDHCGLPYMLTPAFESLLVVHPTGLAQPMADLILTWRADRIGRHPQFLMGSARSIARWCDKNRRAYDTVTVVPDALVSGTHVWVNHGERLVESRWVR